MAIVVDEFGSAIGIITMEDIVEEVVGDIDVGYDFEEYLPRRKKDIEMLDDDTYLVDSRLSVSEVNDLLEINLNTRAAHTMFLVFTPVLLILGEIVPKSIFQQKSDEVAPIAIFPLKIFSIVFYPIIFVFSRIARLMARMLGGGKVEQNLFMTREQIRSVVDMTERTSSVDAFDRGRIRRVIRFGETTVGEAMIPIAEVTAINRQRNILRAIATVRKKGYNRLPVYKGNISNIVGIVTLTTWDMMDPETADKKLEDLIKPPQYVLQFQTIDELLPILRQREDHMAIVVDEFGSAIGIITMEDIVEEVVGDIDVGYDFEEYLPRRKKDIEILDDDSYLVDSRLSVSEVNDLLEINLNTRAAHTIGGLVMTQLGHIPKKGESMTEQDYRFSVEEGTDKAIVKLRVERV